VQQDVVGPCQSTITPVRPLCSAVFSITNMRMRTHQYTISASSPRSSVPAATVRPSIDTSQQRSALCSPSYGTAGRHRSGFRSVPFLPRPSTVRYASFTSRTLDRGGARAVIPCTHDTIPSRGNDRSSICAGNRVDTPQRRRAFSMSFERVRRAKRRLVEQVYSVRRRGCRCSIV
jgi:hypothetical protein